MILRLSPSLATVSQTQNLVSPPLLNLCHLEGSHKEQFKHPYSSQKGTENEQEVGISPWSYQFEIELQVFVLQHGVHTLHLVGDAALRVIQALDEVISVL